MVRAGTQLEEIGQNVLPAIGLANASLAMVRASASIVMEQARAMMGDGILLEKLSQLGGKFLATSILALGYYLALAIE